MAVHNRLGKQGEDEAGAYLESRGYVILHRNWRAGRYELDIVARKEDELVIIEVKTRRNLIYGHPEQAVNQRKIRHIIASTDAYLKHYEIDLPVRFDVITLVGVKPPFAIEHFEEAFFPPLWTE